MKKETRHKKNKNKRTKNNLLTQKAIEININKHKLI